MKDRIKINGEWYVREDKNDFEVIRERSLFILGKNNYLFYLKDVLSDSGEFFGRPYLEIRKMPNEEVVWLWDNSNLIHRLLKEDITDIWGYNADKDIMIVGDNIEEVRTLVQAAVDLGWFEIR